MKKNHETPLRLIQETLGLPTQASFAERIGVTPSHLSRSAKRPYVTRTDADRIRGLIRCDEFSEEQRRRVALLLRGKSLFDESSLAGPETPAKTGWEQPGFAPIERAAWGWAMAFRNSVLLQELSAHACAQGRECRRIGDGVILLEGAGRGRDEGRRQTLFCHPKSLLNSGTVVLLGASERHPNALDLFARFSERLNATIRLKELSDSPAYFGYPTILKCLEVRRKDGTTKSYWSQRYTDGERLLYRDVGAIFYGRLDDLFEEHQYGKGAKRLIWIAAIQRLANGVGMRLVRDAEFRSTYLGEISFDGNGAVGAVFFEVTVAHTSTGDEIQSLKKLFHLSAPTAQRPPR